jgi:hypothetical protein
MTIGQAVETSDISMRFAEGWPCWPADTLRDVPTHRLATGTIIARPHSPHILQCIGGVVGSCSAAA